MSTTLAAAPLLLNPGSAPGRAQVLQRPLPGRCPDEGSGCCARAQRKGRRSTGGLAHRKAAS